MPSRMREGMDTDLDPAQRKISIRNFQEAGLDMITDYLTIRYGHADKPGLQRTVESFGKI